MNGFNQKLCAWCGILCTLGWLIGFFAVAGFVPPPAPSLNPDEIATIFRDNSVGIRVGMMVMVLGSVLYLPWSVAISAQMRRIEADPAVLSWTQMIMGGIFVWVFLMPSFIWEAAAFRPDQTSPELIQRLNDLAWMNFISPVATIFVQGVCIGIVILQDKRAQPIFPRWVGWFNIWAVIIYLPGSLVPLFKTGPFAWNGLLALWIPLVIFVAWMVGMSVLLLKAIDRQAAENGAAESANARRGTEHLAAQH